MSLFISGASFGSIATLMKEAKKTIALENKKNVTSEELVALLQKPAYKSHERHYLIALFVHFVNLIRPTVIQEMKSNNKATSISIDHTFKPR